MTDETGTTGAVSVPPKSTCTDLVERLKAQQPEAWRQLVRLYGPLVYYWCRRYQLPPEDAADVFQEVFSAALQGIASFRRQAGQGRFRGWLWVIARNKILDHFRGRDCRQQPEGGTEALRRLCELPEHLAELPADDDERSQANALFHRALETVRAEFEQRTWDAFWRSVVAGEDTSAVAASLGMSKNAVRLAKSRILRRARVLLGDCSE